MRSNTRKPPWLGLVAGLLFSMAGAAQPPPALVFSTYLGGSDRDEARSLAIDASGRIHVVGFTDSPDFPVVGGLANPEHEEYVFRDAFLFRLAPGGSLIFSSYFDDERAEDYAEDVALGAAGSAFVAGWWENISDDVEFSLKRVHEGGQVSFDLISEYGESSETAEGVAVAPDGKVFVVGITCSPYIFGTFRPPRPTCEGFLVTWAGGPFYERALLLGELYPRDVAADAAGSVYLTGLERSTGELVVTKIDAAGSFVYSTVLGVTGRTKGSGSTWTPRATPT